MDLKNNKITVGELMDHPGARAVLQKRLSFLTKHPPMGAARTVTLEQILAFAQGYVQKNKIEQVLSDLRRA